jgi:glycosyltransferase involved in cell wall biosynthesis
MKVSIITVCLNAEASIEKTIQSVISQTFTDIEYIIIDGQSNDNTLEIIDKYRDSISKVISEHDQGIYDAMNKGIGISSGDIIYFLNADDYLYDKNVIKDVVREFMQQEDLSLLYGTVLRINIPEPELKSGIATKRTTPVNNIYDLYAYSICHQGLFVKKSVYDSIGMFDLKYRICADVDWIARCFKRKIPVTNLSRKVAFYNYTGFNYRNRKTRLKEKRSIFLRYFSSQVAVILFKEAIRKLRCKFTSKQE